MSNPKEKANELVNKFMVYSYYDAHDLTTPQRRKESKKESAIQCALIAVDEILKSCPIELVGNAGKFTYTDDYWQQVKTELEKL